MPGELPISSVANIVLTLLLLFQWWKQYSKEQSVKNGLLAVRRIIGRIQDGAIASKAEDAVDTLDGVLATLDTRRPFSGRLEKVLSSVRYKFQSEAEKEVVEIPGEVR